MKAVVFENEGVIDGRSIKTFGVSVKNKTDAIGYFGTGLKYAISIILRHDLEISIFSDKKEYKFTKEIVQVRGKDIEIVCMNGEELSFTTDLGKNWQLWQAYRELYCNCIDEDGQVLEADLPTVITSDEYTTKVAVFGDEFYQVHEIRDTIVINERKIYDDDCYTMDIYEGESDHVFYKKVRVLDLRTPTIYTYNLAGDVKLTEDRTIYDHNIVHTRLLNMVSQSENKELINKIIKCGSDYYEYGIEYDDLKYQYDVSETFNECLAEAYYMDNDNLNPSATAYFKATIERDAPTSPPSTIKKTKKNQKIIDQVKAIIEKEFGYSVEIYISDDISYEKSLNYDDEIYLEANVFYRGKEYILAEVLRRMTEMNDYDEDNSSDWAFLRVGQLLLEKAGDNEQEEI